MILRMDLDFIPTNQGYTSTKTNMEYMSRGLTFSQTIILGIHVQLKFALSKVVNPQLKSDSPWKHKQLLQRIYSGRNRTPTTDSSEEYHYSLPKIRKLSEPQRFQDSEAPTYSNSVVCPNNPQIPRNSRRIKNEKKKLKVRRWAKKGEEKVCSDSSTKHPPTSPPNQPFQFGTPFQPPQKTPVFHSSRAVGLKANISSEGGQNAQDGIHKDPEGDRIWVRGPRAGTQAVRGSGASWEKRVPRLEFDELLVDFKSQESTSCGGFLWRKRHFCLGAEET